MSLAQRILNQSSWELLRWTRKTKLIYSVRKRTLQRAITCIQTRCNFSNRSFISALMSDLYEQLFRTWHFLKFFEFSKIFICFQKPIKWAKSWILFEISSKMEQKFFQNETWNFLFKTWIAFFQSFFSHPTLEQRTLIQSSWFLLRLKDEKKFPPGPAMGGPNTGLPCASKWCRY